MPDVDPLAGWQPGSFPQSDPTQADPLTGWRPIGAPPPADPKADQPPSSLTGTSWQTIVGNPQIYGSIAPPGMESVTPETASGILHGIREGVLDKPAQWLAGGWDWLTGSDEAARVKQLNQDEAAKARAAAQADPGGFSAGNTAGRIAGQTAVINPAIKVGGAALSLVPGIGPILGPLVAGTAGEATPGLPGFVARTAAGTTSGALAGGASAGLSGDNPIRGMVEGGAFGGGLSVGSQAIERALQTLRGTYVPGEVRAPDGSWQASDETAQRATQAKLLTDNGVPVMQRQVSLDPALKPVDAPWSGQSGDITNQQQAFRRASLSQVTGQGTGSTPGAPTLATDQFVSDQANRLRGNFQTVANNNNIDFNSNLAPQLTTLSTELAGVDPATRQALAPYIKTVLGSVSKDAAGNTIISGQKYLDLTGADSPLQTLAGAGGLPGQYAQRVINLLHDGLSASASPADQALLTASRQQYRALQAVKDARGSDGSFQPKDLYRATTAQADRYGGSQGTLDPLAKAGATVLQPSYEGGIGTAAGGAAAAGAGGGIGTIPGLLTMGASHALPSLLGAVGGMAAPAGGMALGLPLALQALNRNPEAVQRAIRTLQGGANFAPYRVAPAVVPPSVVTQQQ